MENGSGEDLDRAIDDLTRAMTLRSDYAPAYVNRAGAHLQRNGPGDLDRAFEDLERALKIEPRPGTSISDQGQRLPDARRSG